METATFVFVFFFYGLAFFIMGLAILLERGHGFESRLVLALAPLAAFGLVHGSHEWLEMFDRLGVLPWAVSAHTAWESLRIILLSASFLALGMFGATLLDRRARPTHLRWQEPLALSVLWAVGTVVLLTRLGPSDDFWGAADVWTRYMLAVPGAVLAAAGLMAQRREFERLGLGEFGFDCAMAAVGLVVYGLVGQTFVGPSVLPPSTVFNSELFLHLFGFPVQVLRAGMAILSSYFVIRFLRSFEVEQRAERVRLQTVELRQAEEREVLRLELLRRNVGAQEAERRRIARDLHDETGQALTALGLGLRSVEGAIGSDPARATQNLRHLERLVTHSLEELQRLISDLRPSHLDDLGLPAALRWYTGEVQGRSPLTVSVEVIGQPRPLGPALNTALFRMAQEALTNTVKHAQADHAWVRLRYGADAIELEAEDNGQGFDPVLRRQGGGWGLLGLEERATLLGGSLEITSDCSRGGTRIRVTFPYDSAARANNEHPTPAG